MNESRRTREIVLGLVSLCSLLYFFELGRIPFYNHEESKEALIVSEIVNHGEWILPLRNGVELPLKPPLFHWIGASLSLLVGEVSEFSVRFPSALFSTATVIITFLFGYTVWNWRVGLLSAVMLSTSPEWVRWSVTARSDMALVFFVTAALFLFFIAFRERGVRPLTFVLLYTSVGFAALAKGPLGVLLPALVIGSFLFLASESRFRTRIHFGYGMAIAGGIAISWYAAATFRGGEDFFYRQILDENVFRFFSSEKGGPSREHSLLYYIPTLLAGMLPWSVFFPAVAVRFFCLNDSSRDKKGMYLLIWGAVQFVFFSLASGKRSNYLLPMYPALSLLLGIWWHDMIEGSAGLLPIVKNVARVCGITLGISALVFMAVSAAQTGGVDIAEVISPFLHPRDRSNVPIVLGVLYENSFLVLAWLSILGVVITWYLWAFVRGEWAALFTAAVIVVSSVLYFSNALFHPLLARDRTYKPFMLGVRKIVQEEPLHFFKGTFDYGAIFYAGRHLHDYDASVGVDEKFPTHGSVIYLLVREADWSLLQSRHAQAERLATSIGRGPDKKDRLVLAALIPELIVGDREEAQEVGVPEKIPSLEMSRGR